MLQGGCLAHLPLVAKSCTPRTSKKAITKGNQNGELANLFMSYPLQLSAIARLAAREG